MSLEKCESDMPAHTEGWNLSKSAKEASEAWLKDCIGQDFDLDAYFSGRKQSSMGDVEGVSMPYSLSLAQQCEYA